MGDDPFGDLRDWDKVLDRLKQLREGRRLDSVQPGLIRLIRCRFNWRIREHALVAAREVEQPRESLLASIQSVAADRETYCDARILAVKALAELSVKSEISAGQRESVRLSLKDQLARPEAPVLRLSVEKALEKIEQLSSVTT